MIGAVADNVVQCTIQRWSVWPGGLEAGARLESQHDTIAQSTDLGFIDALSRRRLGRLARIALHVANQAAGGANGMPMVFASRHGELTRSLGMLDGLAQDDMPSPAAFSLSVHNATSGIYSIARGNQAPATAIAAGEETLLWALHEAALSLREADAALLVYADEPLPGPYQAYAEHDEPAHAIGLLLERGDNLTLRWQANANQAPSPMPLSLAFAACLGDTQQGLQWFGERLAVTGNWHGRAH